jgi:hypothetical protein
VIEVGEGQKIWLTCANYARDLLKKVGAGNYSSTGSYLSQEGKWEINLTVQRIGEYDINQRIDADVK